MATKRIGILTAGGDAPGLNAAIRGFGKAAIGEHGWKLIGFRDGMRGLAENRYTELDGAALSGILTTGGTMLGTSRDKVHRMMVDGEVRDMIPTIVENVEKDKLDALVCLGGGGTAKNARRLMDAGINVLHLPKTIDNDIVRTDTSFGFSTALEIATEAVDRLHSTAHSHHRIILTEIMGHRAGWLALGAGVAGGADVILLPEVPYSVEAIAEKIQRRRKQGSSFSVVAVAEGARSVKDAEELAHAQALVKDASSPELKAMAKKGVKALEASHRANTFTLAEQLEAATGLEARVTILGYVQRGGTPNAADRLLGTRLGVAGANAIADGKYGVMVADRGHDTALVPLKDVAGKVKYVPRDHEWIKAARAVGTALGD
ncbi:MULTISPECIES: 6-phosphofructokinase [Actinomyces]|uniref:ATP-dependent 6-phosphofructokinase n=1 Tax=Actinomyces succiniciruminis TaxID=1522002 RepID=A0A1L7RLM2_9ACTO|nr:MULTISPECIES: ATP-dependent 6-phosphofructokinase [Actinomyces]MBE6475320.1 ATP-dependent 6-phosphofructokinase [Actinomyces succiniciruminis]MBM6979886.1 ATP-dependent 6-phosphofructokinase [Actinomyces succiniciruminis]RAX19932.1 ATP-dependent 6-phosphofructokinase [Actinomyces sp. Z5]RAX23027.1 ATP-dependent 6-phosphofructokinase [Actinomyces sp. Z3]CED92049.1 6-phosphofructokinase 3 [Actinomyces succiniciruminis]